MFGALRESVVLGSWVAFFNGGPLLAILCGALICFLVHDGQAKGVWSVLSFSCSGSRTGSNGLLLIFACGLQCSCWTGKKNCETTNCTWEFGAATAILREK